MTDSRMAAQNWARVWRKGWNRRDAEALLALYADDVAYWSGPFDAPYVGRDALRQYFDQAFAAEHSIQSWFGEPVVDGDRAAIPWWGTMVEEGSPTTLAGISLLRFNDAGLVVEQWDGWNQADKMRQRPMTWAS